MLSVADEDIGADSYSWKIVALSEALLVKAGVEIDPDYLDLASPPQWLTCRLRLLAGYNVVDIDPYSILLNKTVEAPWAWLDACHGEIQIREASKHSAAGWVRRDGRRHTRRSDEIYGYRQDRHRRVAPLPPVGL